MKLKKIASLMLAGVMAVSMLAGCSTASNDKPENPSNPGTPVADDFTSTVLSKTSEYAQNVLSVNTDENLDKAVAYVCDNSVVDKYQYKLDTIIDNSTYYQLFDNAKKFLPESDYNWNSLKNWNFTNATADTTYVGMYVVGGKMTDEWIANELATKIDSWVNGMNEDGYEYSIRVVKGTCQNAENVSEYKTSTIVGLLVEVDDTHNNH